LHLELSISPMLFSAFITIVQKNIGLVFKMVDATIFGRQHNRCQVWKMLLSFLENLLSSKISHRHHRAIYPKQSLFINLKLLFLESNC